MRAAAALQQNGVLGSLLAVVASVRRCHSGEAFVRLKVGAARVCGKAAGCSLTASVWLVPASKAVQHADQVPPCCALQDPTGAIGGTLTKAVLQAEPDLRQGAVVRLRRVTVLRTPPPRSLNHLCITL